MTPTSERLSQTEIKALAKSAVGKIDTMGPRGVTLCSMDEIEALAVIAVQSGLLADGDPQ